MVKGKGFTTPLKHNLPDWFRNKLQTLTSVCRVLGHAFGPDKSPGCERGRARSRGPIRGAALLTSEKRVWCCQHGRGGGCVPVPLAPISCFHLNHCHNQIDITHTYIKYEAISPLPRFHRRLRKPRFFSVGLNSDNHGCAQEEHQREPFSPSCRRDVVVSCTQGPLLGRLFLLVMIEPIVLLAKLCASDVNEFCARVV